MMYCSTCGMPVQHGLSYCNYCGGMMTGAKNSPGKPAEMRPELLVWSMVAVLVFGLVAITFLMMGMKMVGLNEGVIYALTVLSFMIMIMIEGTLIFQLTRRRRSEDKPLLSKPRTTQELEAAEARSLPESMPSVTEHTTRAFEPTYRERN